MSGSRLAGGRLIAWVNLALCIAASMAQLCAQERAAFDAVVIGRGPTDRPPLRTLHVTPKSLTAPGPSLHQLVTQAFGVEDYQLSGLRGWMDSEAYAVYATAEVAMDRARMMTALRELLVTRFQLKFHRETREMKVLALTVDKGGAKLVSLADCGFRRRRTAFRREVEHHSGLKPNSIPG